MYTVGFGESGPEGPARMAAAIEALIRRAEATSEIRSVGVTLEVAGDNESVTLKTEPPVATSWPELEVRIAEPRWWQPECPQQAERWADKLSAALRYKWERWVNGGAP